MRTTCRENFSFIAPFLRELLPKNLQNWAQLGQVPNYELLSLSFEVTNTILEIFKYSQPTSEEQ